MPDAESMEGKEIVEPSAGEKPLKVRKPRRPNDIVTEEEYRKMMADPVFAMKGVREQAGELGVNEMTLHRYRKEIDWKTQTEGYRAKYWFYAPHIDMAVIRKAMKGDLKAAELYYMKHEGWDRGKGGTTVNVNIGKFEKMTNEELLAQLNIKAVEVQKVEEMKVDVQKEGNE